MSDIQYPLKKYKAEVFNWLIALCLMIIVVYLYWDGLHNLNFIMVGYALARLHMAILEYVKKKKLENEGKTD